jgi:hypothetical protein
MRGICGTHNIRHRTDRYRINQTRDESTQMYILATKCVCGRSFAGAERLSALPVLEIQIGSDRIIFPDSDRDLHPGHTELIRIQPIPDRYQFQAKCIFTFIQKILICCPKYLLCCQKYL